MLDPIIIRRAPEIAVRLALEQVQTVSGAHRILAAEQAGLCRAGVLRAAERRIAELESSGAKAQKARIVASVELIEKPRKRGW